MEETSENTPLKHEEKFMLQDDRNKKAVSNIIDDDDAWHSISTKMQDIMCQVITFHSLKYPEKDETFWKQLKNSIEETFNECKERDLIKELAYVEQPFNIDEKQPYIDTSTKD